MDGATRIWLDDPNPIFRMGLAASLRDPRFVVVGESAGLMPPPPHDTHGAEWDARLEEPRRSTRW